MPKDFWNYNVNPILGYKYEKIARNRKQEQTTIEWKVKPNSNNCGRRKD